MLQDNGLPQPSLISWLPVYSRPPQQYFICHFHLVLCVFCLLLSSLGCHSIIFITFIILTQMVEELIVFRYYFYITFCILVDCNDILSSWPWIRLVQGTAGVLHDFLHLLHCTFSIQLGAEWHWGTYSAWFVTKRLWVWSWLSAASWWEG